MMRDPLTPKNDGDSPDLTTVAQTSSDQSGLREALPPPTDIGPYHLVKLLGEGGMGEVWLAEQTTPVKRFVALKLIRSSRFDFNLLTRFNAERQILAMMDHPAIAKVFDAGSTEDGRPYFVMEHVAGVPITQYCDRNRLSLIKRMKLFLRVCEGVQHAHQKAVLHRDLKPTNILVIDVDGEPTPRIIDFGLARADEDNMSTRVTGPGVMVGTPGYMSPEQAAGRLDIDTRADLYSLGVVLYEMLTGTLPIQTSGPMLDQMRQLLEIEPPSPSSRLRSLAAASTIASYRSTDPIHLMRVVRGDVDSITMKALEKDREMRYASVGELADDLRRYLRREPVIACPPSTSYRLRKFVLRHRLAVGFAATAGILVTSFAITMAIQARRIGRERDRANLEAVTAQRISDFLTGLFSRPDPAHARGGNITARELLDEGAREIQVKLKDQPAVRSRLMATIGDAYSGLGLYPQAEPLLVEALDLSRRTLGKDNIETLQIQERLGWLRDKQGHYTEAEDLMHQAFLARQRIQGPEHQATLTSAAVLGGTYYHLGRYADADKLLSDALDTSRRTQGDDSDVTLQLLSNLALAYDGEQLVDKEAAIWQEIYEKRKKILGADAPSTIAAMQNLAYTRTRQKKYEEAERLLRDALQTSTKVMGTAHPTTLGIRNNLANVMEETGRLSEAEQMHRETLDTRVRMLGLDNPDTLFSMNNLANVLVEQKRYNEAEKLYFDALHGEVRVLGEKHPEIATVWYNLARVEAGKGHHREALTYLESAMAHGWSIAEDLEQDQEWAALKTNPAYQRILAEARRRSSRQS